MGDGTQLVVKPGRKLDYQILICGLMLVLQLVAGEDHKADIFSEYYHCEDTFHFRFIQKKIEKRIPTVDAAFDTIKKELRRPAGARVAQLLQSVYFNLLSKASQVAKKRSPKKRIDVLNF